MVDEKDLTMTELLALNEEMKKEEKALKEELGRLERLRQWVSGIRAPGLGKLPARSFAPSPSKHMLGNVRATKAYADGRQKQRGNRRPQGYTKRKRLGIKR